MAGEANGRFIKAGQPQWPFYQSRCSFYQGRLASVAVLLDNGRFIMAKDQANGRSGRFRSGLVSGRLFLSRAGKANSHVIKAGKAQRQSYQSRSPFYQGRPASMAVLSTMAALSRPRTRPARNGRFINQKRPNDQIS